MGYAELAGGAGVVEGFEAGGSRGNKAGGALARGLGLEFGQAAVEFHILGACGYAGAYQHRSGGKESAPSVVILVISSLSSVGTVISSLSSVGTVISSLSRNLLVQGALSASLRFGRDDRINAGSGYGPAGGFAEAESALFAGTDAVEAIDAAGVVNPEGAFFDAGGFADAGAGAALDAFVFVDPDPEELITADAAEYGADGADCVAVCAAPEPGAEYDGDESDPGRDEQGSGAATHDAADHPSVCAVRFKKGDDYLQAGDDSGYGQCGDGITYPSAFPVEFESLAEGLGLGKDLAEGAADPEYYVLEYAQRAYDRAVDASCQQGDEQDSEHYGDVAEGGAADEPQGGGHHLEFGKPAPPVPADSDKQEGDPDKAQRCKYYSDFS